MTTRRALLAPLALAALLLLAAGLALGPMQESDLFFRLRIGDEILRTGHIPPLNLLSFTYPDHPDLDLAWLFEVGAAALFRLGGFRAIVIGKTVVVCAALALAFVVCRRRGAGASASALALGAAALVMQDRMVERPHVFSFVGEAATLLALATLDAGRTRRAFWLVPAVALWVNLHAGAFAAPALCALFAFGAWFDRRPSRDVRAALALGGGTAVALLCSPAGPDVFRYLGFHTRIFDLHPVDEFRGVTLVSDAPLVAYGAVVAVLVAATFIFRRRDARMPADGSAVAPNPIGVRHLLPALGLAALGARSIRFGADFALCAAPLAAVALAQLGRRFAGARRLEGEPPPASSPRALARADVAVAALLVAVAVVPRVATARAGHPFFDIDLDQDSLPIEATRFAEANGLRDRMYNDFEIGSYLAWEGFPRHRVFVDPRLPAYPDEFHRLLGRTDVSRAEWDAAMDRYGVTSALLAYAGINRRSAWWNPARWALVYRRHDARVFVRRLPRFAALIAREEIPATFSFTAEEGTVTLPIETQPPDSPVPSCEWDRRLGDLFLEIDDGKPARAVAAYRRALAAPPGCLAPDAEAAAAAYVGSLAFGERRAADALPLLDRSLALAPDDVVVRTNRALALEALSRVEEARAEWAEIATRARGTALGTKAVERAGRR